MLHFKNYQKLPTSLRQLVQHLHHLHGPQRVSLAAWEVDILKADVSLTLLHRLGSLGQRVDASAFCAGADCLYNDC